MNTGNKKVAVMFMCMTEFVTDTSIERPAEPDHR